MAGSLAAKILLLLLVLSFVIWGIGDMLRQNSSSSTIAHVGDSTIQAREFQIELKNATENMRRVMGDHFTPEMIRMTNLHVQVLQKLINQKLLTMESQSLGLLPSDTDVVRQIRSNPLFQDKQGNFDKVHFESMLRNSNLSEKTYVSQLRKDIATQLLIDTLISNASSPANAAITLLSAREEQRNCTLYTLAPSLVSGIGQPDDKTIAEFYASHSANFTAPEYRNLSYAVISPTDSLGKVAVLEDDLHKAYRERSEDFKRPERREVQQLLYASEDKATKALAMLKSGTPLEQVASQTEILNKTSLSLGKVGRNSIIENASDAVFSLQAGEITDPIQSPFGWHIFRVVSIEPPSVTPFEEVRASLEKELSQRNADEAQSKLANKLEDTLAAGSTLQEAAKELGLTVATVGPINKQGVRLDGTPARDLPDLDKFLDTAFKIDEKAQSSLVASKGGKYYIVQVDSSVPERLRTLDEVRGLVVASWQEQERAKRLGELAKTIATKFNTDASRATIISQYNLTAAGNVTMKRSTRTAGSITLPPTLVEEAFLQSPNQATQAYKLDKGDYIIAVVNKVIPMAPLESDTKLKDALTEIRSDMQRNLQNEILTEYTRHLSDKYKVSVNEAALDAVIK